MKFEYDIFICDVVPDQKKSDIQDEWTTKFCNHIEILFARLTNTKPKIVQSKDLFGKKEFLNIKAREIFAKSAIFIFLVSSESVKSSQFTDQVKEFSDVINKSDEKPDEEFPRIFKVVKNPVPVKDSPPSIWALPGFNFFYSAEDENKTIIETSENDQYYWNKLVDLAYDFQKSHSHYCVTEIQTGEKIPDKTIFLAEAGNDLVISRDIVKKELKQHGYKVVPDYTLPDEAEKLKDCVIKYLDRSFLAIHLIGSDMGRVPVNSEYPVVDLQNRIAADYFKKISKEKAAGRTDFLRLIWISPDIKQTDKKQASYIEKLKHDEESLSGAEVLEIPLEILKTLIQNRIGSEEKSKPADSKEPGGKNIRIYFIYEYSDGDKIKPVVQWLTDKGFEVVSPAFDAEHTNLVSMHRKHLVECDSALIYYGRDNVHWLNCKLKDLLKAPGYGKDQPFRSKGVIVGKDTQQSAKNFEKDLIVIQSEKEFTPAPFKTFIEKLK